jgi:S-adenosylmethionine:tRNA ribosyltransferase-isomerase
MLLDDFDYNLPVDLIAQTPAPRGESRLLCLNRGNGEVKDTTFPHLLDFIHRDDVLVINDTRVSARRMKAIRNNGGTAEILLIQPVGRDRWKAMVHPGRGLQVGRYVDILLNDGKRVKAQSIEVTEDGGRILLFENAEARDSLLWQGEIPLPPYIHSHLADEERYQTIYSKLPGSAAAPTAGLHFTHEILRDIDAIGAKLTPITLHVGIDTFRPVKEREIEDHKMHGEWYTISKETADIINNASGRIIAVGTTTVRALESAAISDGVVESKTEETRLFITPGYRFKIIDAMLTNFHLPKSTLLMLVSAFGGMEFVRNAYEFAVKNRYRFFSFGDAMLIY